MFSKFFIYRPIFAAVVSIVIVILGLVALVALPVARYPEISPPTIQVSAVYPGANAQTIAETVATPIEQEVNGVENMAYMSSTSSADGTMNLDITFNVGTNLDMANVLVQNRVAVAESRLPEEVRRQGVKVKKRSPDIVLFVSFFSPDGSLDSSFLHNFVKLNVEDEVKRVNGVGDVQTFGTGEYGMRIWLDPLLLKQRGLTTNDVVAAIRAENVEVAAGQIGAPPAPDGQAFQYTVNTTGRFSDPQQFEQIIVRVGADGELTYLRDVARVELGSTQYAFASGYNGQPTAAMAVYQIPGANALEVAEGVYESLDQVMASFEPTYGEALDYAIAYDNTDVVRASIREVVVTLFITLVLVVFTVYVFLQNFRATLIPTVTIPVSLIGTFAAMAALGYSINQFTLFGLVLVIGIVVDDAIVVVENTSRLINDEKMDPKEAATKSMQEVTGPVIATTLVLLAVFVPTIFMGGIVGQLFTQFAVTISIATVFSSINALTLSPSLCGILLKPTREPRGPFRLFNRTLAGTTSGLTAVVNSAIRVAVIGLLVFVGLVAVSVFGFAQLPTGFVPQEDEGYCVMNVQLPDAASLQRTTAVVDRTYDLIHDVPGVRDILGISGFSILDGSAGSNLATFMIIFDLWDQRVEPAEQQAAIVAEINRRVATIQEAQINCFTPPSLPGVGMAGGFSLVLQDRGGTGLTMLENTTGEFVRNGFQRGLLMRSGFRANTPQIFVEIDREQVRELDIALPEVFNTLGAYLGSAYVNDFVRFGRIYQVKAQAESAYRASPDDIRKLEVRNRQGAMIPLGALVTIREVLGPQIVTHHNIYTSAKLNGMSARGLTSGQSMEVIRGQAASTLPPTMGYEWTGLSYQEDKASGGATVIFLFSIILVYLVLAAQYESWSLPMSVCLAVPTALLGAVAAIMLRGLDNNVYTQIGVVLLIGLSTKTAILIVEFAKVQREEGKSIKEAAVQATRLRFRAVLMTAFSFILGVIPLLIASGAGAEPAVKAMGTTVFGGMVVATAVSVVSVPMLFYIIQTISEKLGGGQPAATNPDAPTS
jgi:HAE1 family hydrophobic/amphiphilic exporter-1